MENEEHMERDFQIATQKMLLEQGALLRTILQNQMTILEILSKDGKNPHKEINAMLNENRTYMDRYMREELPRIDEVYPPLKN